MNKLKILAIIFLSGCTLALSAKDYKASLFGVKSDGMTLNTGSIQKAIDYIGENGGGKLVFYVGRYLTGSISLKSNVTIELKEGAVLVATLSPYDYFGVNGTNALIVADGLENIGIIGSGVIEGQGHGVLMQTNAQIEKGFIKETITQIAPALIAMNNCSNIAVEGINLMNACGDVQTYTECKNLKISKLTIRSTSTKNSKGILLADCNGVKLDRIFFETSGAEISSTRKSVNVSAVNCINATGKQVHPGKTPSR